jgi:hypothetical protein
MLFCFGSWSAPCDCSQHEQQANYTSAGKNDSLLRVVRGFAEASLAALAFVLAILLIGTPIALIVRGLHETLSWLVRLRGEMTTLVEALVSVGSVGGGLVLTAVLIRLLVGFFQWRHRFRARAIGDATPRTPLRRQEVAA